MNYKLSLSPLFVLEIIASVLFIVFFGFGNFFIFHTFEYDFWCGFIGNFLEKYA